MTGGDQSDWRPRVVHIIDELPAHGAERLIADMMSHRSRDFDYQVLCLARGGEMEPEIREQGVPVTILGYRGKHDLAVVWRLARWLRANHVNIVHTHLFTADTFGRVAARLAGVQGVFATIHNTNHWKSRLFRLADRVLAHFSTRVIACSEEVGAILLERDRLPPRQVMVISNGISLERFVGVSGLGVRAEFGIADTEPLLALIGRFHPQKGHADLVRALATLRDEGVACRCLFVGNGKLQGELEEQVAGSGLSKHIIFTGYRRDIGRLLAATDVLVLPSHWEGLPMVLLEGMAMERAIVATAVGGVPEVIVEGKSGLLIPPGDVRVLADALRRVIVDAGLRRRLGQGAREMIGVRYNVRHTVGAYERLYREVLGLAGPRGDAGVASRA